MKFTSMNMIGKMFKSRDNDLQKYALKMCGFLLPFDIFVSKIGLHKKANLFSSHNKGKPPTVMAYLYRVMYFGRFKTSMSPIA